MRRMTYRLLFLLGMWCQSIAAQEATEDLLPSYSITGCRYWFDHSVNVVQTTYTGGKVVLDVSQLEEGFHTLHYQILDSRGGASPARTAPFYRIQASDETFKDYTIKSVRYWFDKDYTPREVAYTSGVSNIDVSALEEGFHTLHYQVIDSKGESSPSRTSSFFRLQSNDETFKDYAIKTVRYWFDKDYTPREVAYTSGVSNIDVSAFEEGFHTLHYQVIDSKGESSPSRTSSFFRLQSNDETFKDYAIKTVRYWFDKDYTPREVAYTSGVSNIAVSSLEEGFHTLHYQVIDSKGESSPTRTSSFFRLQPVTEKFKDYKVQTVRYWYDNDVTTVKTEAYDSGIKTLDLSHLGEGQHTLCYQVITDDGQVSPARSVSIDRRLYDIYVSQPTIYSADIIDADPLYAQKPDLKLHYQTDNQDVRGHLTIDAGTTLSLGKFVQTSHWGSKNDGNKYTKAGAEYYHPTTLLNNGFARADSVIIKHDLYRDRWHFISLPFNANVSDIVVPGDTYWALREYDGEARAAGQMTETWKNLYNGDQMEAGRGYILQLTKDGQDKTSCFTFKALNDTKKNSIFTADDVTTQLLEHQSEFAHNRSWNLVGNPYPCFFDTRCISQEGNIIVWNGNGYSAYSLSDDNYVLMPFEAFFIQKPLNADAITFEKDGRQHTHEAEGKSAARRKIDTVKASNRKILNFTVTDGIDTDRARVVINEQASSNFEIGRDAPKFMETQPQSVQLYSSESGVDYAINERPEDDGIMAFSVYAPTEGNYSFTIEGDADNMTVTDTETGLSWNLADGDYQFTATEGMHKNRLLVSLTGRTTAISNIDASEDGGIQVYGSLLLFHFPSAKHVKVYSLDGRMLYNEVTCQSSLKVAQGVYVVDIEGKIIKTMVK